MLRRETVVLLQELPCPSTGAPATALLATTDRLIVSYLTTDGDFRRVIIEFERHRAFQWGPPNDEAWAGHRLAKNGLEPYGAHEVKHSSWIKALEKMNRVHPRHNLTMFEGLHHFILMLKEDTLEVVAKSFRVVDRADVHQYMTSALPKMTSVENVSRIPEIRRWRPTESS